MIVLHTLTLLVTELVALDVPNPPPAPPDGVTGQVSELVGWLKWAGVVAGVVGLIVCGIMMMLGRRNSSAMAADGAVGIPWVIGGLAVVLLSSSIVTAVFT